MLHISACFGEDAGVPKRRLGWSKAEMYTMIYAAKAIISIIELFLRYQEA
jgi:hypothetical protein